MADISKVDRIRQQYEQISLAMRMYPYWALTRGKRPIYPDPWTDSDALLTFEEALAELARPWSVADGIGYIFQEDGPFVGVDLDGVWDESKQQLTKEAEQIIRELNSYTEWSSSDVNIHIILTGELSGELKHEGLLNNRGSVEVYDRKRCFIFTGNRYLQEELPGEPKPAGKAFERLQTRYLLKKDEPPFSTEGRQTKITQLSSNRWRNYSRSRDLVEVESASDLTVEMVYATGCAYSSIFARLWHGKDIGKESPSEHDASFVTKLAYYCLGDPKLMDDCFRASSRYGIRTDRRTPKWDEVHYSNGQTYGEKLISRALVWNPDRFDKKYIQPD